jgi:hypothetical protein
MSNAPAAEVEQLCPQCRAKVNPDATRCWLCGADVSESGRGAVPKLLPADPPGILPSEAFGRFSLASLLLFVTLLCVILGVLTIAPGLGLPLGVILITVWLRTAAATRRRAARGLTVTPLDKVQLFASSFGVTVGMLGLICVAGFAAFFAVCLTCIGTYSGLQGVADESTAMLVAWAVFLCLAVLILIFTFKFAIPGINRWLRNRWRRDIGEPD